MLIQSYGLFWDRDGVKWSPGPGHKRHMWGRRGQYKGTLRLADVWHQRGLYVMYSNTGPYYVGISTTSLGKRLADHTADEHHRSWVRFSWFGFLPLTDDPWSVNVPDKSKNPQPTTIDMYIKDMEALLIKSMGTFNLHNMNFHTAKEWEQVKYPEADGWCEKIAP